MVTGGPIVLSKQAFNQTRVSLRLIQGNDYEHL
jgi:hypothetical protein